jgi:NadR type nicotinamide-nucleotide adenylyltransferase
LKKIVIIGPESTGKSTLSAALAEHYQTIWCKEYARAYLLEHGTDYNFADLLTVAKGQLQLEDAATALVQKENTLQPSTTAKHLFIDTDMYVMKVWCEFVFGNCHHFILQQITQRKYDLYLLCNIDLPWTKDELREYPDLKIRATLFNYYKDLVINCGTPWALVSGTGTNRLQCAIDAIENI